MSMRESYETLQLNITPFQTSDTILMSGGDNNFEVDGGEVDLG